MQDYRDLIVWEKAHEVALSVYLHTSGFPRTESFGLTAQMRRAGVSIASNIAEGCGYRSHRQFERFLQRAMGSASELQYHVLLARDLTYLDLVSYEGLDASITDVKRMLASLISKVHARTTSNSRHPKRTSDH